MISSAYGGKGFIRRIPEKWINSKNEYGQLKKVILYIPGREIHNLKNPDKVQHLLPIDSKKLKNEILAIQKFFEASNIEVLKITNDKNNPPNLCFCRDLFWSSPDGVVLSRMGSEVRKPEEKHIAKTIFENNIPFMFKVFSPNIFEGADLLWINSKTVLVGINNRTSLNSIKILKALFPDLTFIKIPLPINVQHLLGMVQFIGPKKVLLRSEISPKKLKLLLMSNKYKIIQIPESDEVTKKLGMNIVTINPNEIIMPDDCPELERIYIKSKIKVLKKFRINELRKAAGGLACLTGILQRG